MVGIMITKFSQYSSSIPWVFWDKFNLEIPIGSP